MIGSSQVKSRNIPLTRRWLEKVRLDEKTGCLEWTAAKCDGYGRIIIGDRTGLTHRISYEFYCSPIPEGMQVLHHCDNRSCVNPDHLFLGTNAENVADKVAKNRQARGEKVGHKGVDSGNAKLTEIDILAIRSTFGVTQRKLADQYGVSNQQISRIRSGKNWKHLKQVVQ